MSSHQRKLAGICALLILGMCWPVLSEEAAASTDATSELLEGVLVNEPADQVALESEDVDTFADLDITALMDIEVVSVSGSKDNWFTTPAALTVITARDLERGGFQVLPEALRMVPGLNVGRLNASQWAVGVRGFNSLFANKLQVSVDGRSAYNLLFGGVIWNEVDMILPDVEQIEVVPRPRRNAVGNQCSQRRYQYSLEERQRHARLAGNRRTGHRVEDNRSGSLWRATGY